MHKLFHLTIISNLVYIIYFTLPKRKLRQRERLSNCLVSGRARILVKICLIEKSNFFFSLNSHTTGDSWNKFFSLRSGCFFFYCLFDLVFRLDTNDIGKHNAHRLLSVNLYFFKQKGFSLGILEYCFKCTYHFCLRYKVRSRNLIYFWTCELQLCPIVFI